MQIERVPVDSLVFDHSRVSDSHKRNFFKRVSVADSGCWEFSYIQEHNGYGRFGSCGITWRAHRWVMWAIGAIEYLDSRCVLHNCDNRRCVNPAHLRLGDRYENAQDIKKRNRTHLIRDPKLGSKNPQSKLHETDVRHIKRALSRGEKGKDLAAQFSISKAVISEIKNEKLWSHV